MPSPWTVTCMGNPISDGAISLPLFSVKLKSGDHEVYARKEAMNLQDPMIIQVSTVVAKTQH